MSMYGKNHYNIVISLQLIKINEKKKEEVAFKLQLEWVHPDSGWSSWY